MCRRVGTLVVVLVGVLVGWGRVVPVRWKMTGGPSIMGATKIVVKKKSPMSYYKIVKYLRICGLPSARAHYVRNMIRELVRVKTSYKNCNQKKSLPDAN